MCGGDDEAVTCVGAGPLLHLVSHLGSRPHETRTLEQRRPMAGQVGQGDRLSPDMRAEVLHEPSDTRDRLDELVGYGRVELQPGEVIIHQLREQRQRSLRVDELVEKELLALLGVGVDSPTTV